MSEQQKASSSGQDANNKTMANINSSYLFALVEWSPPAYDVISALEIIGRANCNLNSGDLVFIRRQQRVVPATIIIFSGM